MNKERRLGRGLEALLGHGPDFGGTPQDQSFQNDQPSHQDGSFGHDAGASTDVVRDDGLVYIGVYDISPNRFQPRQDFDDADLDELAESIRQHGVIQPLVVRRVDDGRIELISGERRLRAAIKAGWAQVPAWIRQAEDRQVAEIAIVENIQRKDLNPLEKAASFQRYLDNYGGTKEELAARISIDRSTIANLIRLLELPAHVQNLLRAGAITQGHARALLPLGDEGEQIRFAQRVVDEQLSVRAIEGLVTDAIRAADNDEGAIAGSIAIASGDGASMHGAFDASYGGDAIPEGSNGSGGNHHGSTVSRKQASKSARTRRAGTRTGHVGSLEKELRAVLGTKVEIRETARGRGRIIVHFSSHEEFERLRAHMADHLTTSAQTEAG